MFDGKTNPVARSNVVPGESAGRPSRHSTPSRSPFPPRQGQPSFVIAGSAEARPGEGSYRERIVRWGESGADALREKAVFVLGAMEARLGALGFTWADTTATQVYTVFDLHPFLAD